MKIELTLTVKYDPTHTAVYVIETDSLEYAKNRMEQLFALHSTPDANRQAYEEG